MDGWIGLPFLTVAQTLNAGEYSVNQLKYRIYQFLPRGSIRDAPNAELIWDNTLLVSRAQRR
jgi:hypothetical protein